MSGVISSTTKAQISGHKFLVRRVEHGVVLGDTRMISDPLGARKRAALFGLIGVAIIAAGSGALALFAPAVDPGDAPIIRTESGALYVRLPSDSGTALHPVANEASARLVVGKPEAATKASAAVLDGQQRGAPIGILGAPGVIAPHPQPAHTWSAVHSGSDVTVVAGTAPAPLTDAQGLLAHADGRTWVITTAGRAELPPDDTPLGRSIRRRLGITIDTPMWRPPAQLLSAVTELPPYREVTGDIIATGTEYWLLRHDGLVPLTGLQAQIASDLGVVQRPVPSHTLPEYPDAVRVVAELPLATVQWQTPTHVWVRADGRIGLGEPAPNGISLAGQATATRFSGPSIGAIGVDTGNGIVLVTDYGVTHTVATPADAAALGVVDPQTAPWPILALLPRGAELSHTAALKPQG